MDEKSEKLPADKLCAKHKVSVETLLATIEKIHQETAKWGECPSTEKKLKFEKEMKE